MCSARKAKEVTKKDTRPRKPATTNADAQGNLPTTPSPESATALAYQAELEELRRIIASQKKQLDNAQLRGQQPEGLHLEPRPGLALSVLLIVGWHENTASPERDASSSPPLQRGRQPLAPRLVVLNGVVDEALRDRADPSSIHASSRNQSEKPVKHKRADIWQRELGFETYHEYLDFRVRLHIYVLTVRVVLGV